MLPVPPVLPAQVNGVEAPTVEPEPAGANWPCFRCGERVAIELPECPACGSGFMQAGSGHGAHGAHGVGGRFGTPGKQTQLGIMIGGAGLVCIVILVALFIVGALF